ncbi:MAG: C4-dicarboxylate ABC transporter permease [Rhodobacterales bacterium]|nr:MAG: C4-dicarboxylate ABC transporter permease [Rhodobacterales bacterium]
MDPLTLGAWSVPVLLLMIFLRAPIGLAMLLTGIGGLWLVTGSPNVFMARLKNEVWTTFSNYNLSIIPMFLLMGQFATLSGMSRSLFRAAEAFLGHRKGGVAMATVGACAGFGAICGSSLATAATMTRVALPEMKSYGYSGGFATATLAAGGTLGILIPPSVILVIYAILTEQNIAKLFTAAVIPGLLAMIGYMITIGLYVRLVPGAAGVRAPQPWGERLKALLGVWPVILIFGSVIIGIAGDWDWSKPGFQALFTPTEGAAIGAAGTALVALFSGALSGKVLAYSIRETAISTAMIFVIVLGAGFYNGFLAYTQLPQALAEWVGAQGFAPLGVLIAILVVYLLFGCVMDSLSMILLTIPIFWPLISQLDFGLPEDQLAIWFGILVLIVVEVGLITPPVGLNLFIISGMAPETPITKTYRAVVWFVMSDLLRVAVLIAFPAITLALIR